MKGKIIITLRSDLCAASGDGFSLSIDTDVCSDKCGLPFIPSRRLKGCLREAAGYIGCERIDKIFGISGDIDSGDLYITDARLEEYQSLRTQAAAKGYSPEQVLALFTSVKASTAIENDTAKENSLRFMRVVNHYSPFDESELKFISYVEYSDDDAECLDRICKAVRNIGYKRTRGFGSVKCVFERNLNENRINISVPDDNREYELRFSVSLDSPLMFPGKTSMETLDYIPGGTVLGACAAGYLKNHEADERFEELFLKGGLLFSDMSISEGKKASEPAPAVLGRAKDDKEIRYIFREDNHDEDKPLPKAFKGGWLIDNKEIKPAKETIYHHGRRQGDSDKLLYTQECLSEGQIFSGYIRGSSSALSDILQVFKIGKLNLGRSKSAQYSSCRIIAADCVNVTEETAAAGEVYALLCSDVLLLDDNADFSTDINVLAAALGATVNDEDKKHSSLRYKTVMGYMSVGRYKRSHIRAFEKGSVIRFTSDKSLPKYITIGERQNEGFGVVKFCTKDELLHLGRTAPEPWDENYKTKDQLIKLIEENETRYELYDKALNYAKKKFGSVKSIFNASFIGRLLLMVGQAADENDLDDRILSIKDDKKREEAIRFKSGAKELYSENEWREFLRIALTVLKYKTKEMGKNE